ncbi:MAG: hydrogenase 2 operon protein HybA, partial [Alphaproteobacteria bacterium]|nr:hydrogenase 2 operon protein HybA [Alphaproteobacteria bacterium]
MTEVDRRNFLMGAGIATAAAAAPAEASASFVREPKELPPQAVGLLYDSTLCIGCKACVSACKVANDMPPDVIPARLAQWNVNTWDSAEDLSGHTLNVIKAFRDGDGAQKDREVNGFAFVKRSCLHCIDPSCVSVCPVKAMRKDPVTGIVTHDPDACIGCRYCVFGCPFNVPQYDYTGAFGKIAKCQMCNHLQKQGKIPACADVCPTGATLFGPVRELEQEMARRLAAAPGDTYEFPRGKIGNNRPVNRATVPTYVRHIYGEHEAGGTQMRFLSGVPFEKLGLPSLGDVSPARYTEGMQHTLYHWMIAPVLAFLGFAFLARRHMPREGGDDATK